MSHDYITTFSGRNIHLDLSLLREEDIVETDIFQALPHINRYTGHTLFPYSVAQHCLQLSAALDVYGADPNVVEWALVHDFAEAYINDIASPFKRSAADLAGLEDAIMAILARRYGLTPECPSAVKEWDKRICNNELTAMRPGQTGWWHELEAIPYCNVWEQSVTGVRHELIRQFNRLFGDKICYPQIVKPAKTCL